MNKSFDLSCPNMGWSKYAFAALYRGIKGVNVVLPPPVNSSMVEIGVKLSPEFICFPFKVTLGELIYLVDKLKVRAVVFPIDKGPCRMGFYTSVQQTLMVEYGLDFNMLLLQQDSLFPETDWLKPYQDLEKLTGNKIPKLVIWRNVIRFLFKAKYIEDINSYAGVIRCREVKKGDTNKVVKNILNNLDQQNTLIGLFRFGTFIRKEFQKIPIKRNFKPFRVIISGEIHVLLEQYVNFDIIRRMGDMGIEVHQTFNLFDWILHKMHVNVRRRKLEEIARPYIPMDIGGEAEWDIGAYIEGQKNGFDGMVLVYPFTCMPETSVRSIIDGLSPDPFYMPIIYFAFDESSAYEGMRTRLEAFVDMMESNRKNNPKFKDRYVEPEILAEIYDNKHRSVTLKSIIQGFASPFLKNKFIDNFRKIPQDKLNAYYLSSSTISKEKREEKTSSNTKFQRSKVVVNQR